MDPKEFLKMSNEEIKKKFKNFDFIFSLKQKIEEKTDEDKTNAILKKFKACPKCKMLVDKFDGYIRNF
jgi:DNA replicative helicase MCM subunit Mcm2 (Cdc46/Mcm family)